LHDAVQPPSDQVLAALPSDNEFLVPVVLEDPNESFEWDVFINYYLDPKSEPVLRHSVLPTPGTVDGGVVPITFQLFDTDFPDPTACNHIDFLVAQQFNEKYQHTPNSTGGDIVTWLYSTAGASACLATYDAGDGAFPETEAATDGLPLAPAEGGDP
jgi:hypothetical protein